MYRNRIKRLHLHKKTSTSIDRRHTADAVYPISLVDGERDGRPAGQQASSPVWRISKRTMMNYWSESGRARKRKASANQLERSRCFAPHPPQGSRHFRSPDDNQKRRLLNTSRLVFRRHFRSKTRCILDIGFLSRLYLPSRQSLHLIIPIWATSITKVRKGFPSSQKSFQAETLYRFNLVVINVGFFYIEMKKIIIIIIIWQIIKKKIE